MPRRALPIAQKFGPNDVVRAATEAAAAMLSERSTAAALDAGDSTGAWVDDLVEAVAKRLPPQRPCACEPGCAYCCHLKVLVTAPEALALAAHLRATLDDAALASVRARVAASDARTHGLDTDARTAQREPCPLLEGGRCVGYAARPAACRGANSADVGACEQNFGGEDVPVPVYKAQLQIAEAVRIGVANGAMMCGLDGRPLELVAALRVALEDAAALEAWTRGEPVFEPALDAEADAAIRAMLAGR